MLKIKKFFQKYEAKIVLAAGFILVSAVSFGAGYLKGKSVPENPLIISQKGGCPAVSGENQKTSESLPAENSVSETEKKNCAFVGSKNSNKYHLPTCQWAKRIKPENLVCFSSTEDAKQKGYQPDKGCVK